MADHVVFPVSLDPLLPHNIRFVGKALGQWRQAWKAWLSRYPEPARFALPSGIMAPDQ